MRRYLSTTRGRLVLIQVALLGAAILLADIVLYAVIAISDSRAADDVLQAQAININNSITVVGTKVIFDPTLPSETEQGIAVAAAIVKPDGSIVQTAHQPLSTSQLMQAAAAARAQPAWMTMNDAHGVPRRLLAQTIALDGDAPTPGHVVVVSSRSIQELQTTLSRTALLLVALFVIVVVAGGVLAHRLAGRVLKPVRQIAALARSLTKDDLHERVTAAVSADELRDLVDTFNEMLDRLEDGFISLRRFTADASHELRTPLTLMRTQVEGVLAMPRDAAGYRDALAEVQRELVHMSRLADQLLVLARADAGVLVPARSAMDVADTLFDTAARWEGVAGARDVTVRVNAPDSGVVQADPDLLRRVLDNLFDNAIRHSPSGGDVSLSAAPVNGHWVISVADQGPGVSAEVRSRLFERFARSDRARHNDYGGAGLGLAVSRAIVEAHNGRLDLSSSNGNGGAVFRVELPAG
jgi:heavy metal sensor kinase